MKKSFLFAIFCILSVSIATAEPHPFPTSFTIQYGGQQGDEINDIAITSTGQIWFAGTSSSPDYPNLRSADLHGIDVIHGRLSPIGNIEQTQLIDPITLGDPDWGNAVGVDEADNIYIAGTTNSVDFCDFVTDNPPIQPYQGGGDGFLLKLNADGDLQFCTYLGGDELDRVEDIWVDGQMIWLVGGTFSDKLFPNHAGLRDGFVMQVDADGKIVNTASFGGSGQEEATAIEIDEMGNLHVVGWTQSADWSTEPSANFDAFYVQISADLTPSAPQFFGGSGVDRAFTIALSPNGRAVIAGSTQSADFPLTDNAPETVPPSPPLGQRGWFIELNEVGEMVTSSYVGTERYSTISTSAYMNHAFWVGGTQDSDGLLGRWAPSGWESYTIPAQPLRVMHPSAQGLLLAGQQNEDWFLSEIRPNRYIYLPTITNQ